MVINTAGNVILADVDKDIRMPIGAPLPPGGQSQVSTAVWSPTGQWTAWSVDSAQAGGIREVRLHDEASDEAGVLVEEVSAFCLCPSPCVDFDFHNLALCRSTCSSVIIWNRQIGSVPIARSLVLCISVATAIVPDVVVLIPRRPTDRRFLLR